MTLELQNIAKVFNAVTLREDGATAIEYALIASFVALAVIGALGAIPTNLAPVFETVSGTL